MSSTNETIPLVEDLYRYNDWANERLLDMCDGLTNEQLDAPLELGFGSLRNTLFHILTAEEIWLERWQVVPWRPFPTDSMGLPPDDVRARLKQISQARQQMMTFERDSDYKRVVNYKDSRRVDYSHPLDVLLVHVANHSVYHRAQALHYLKRNGRTVPVGLDYSMYKLARPSVEQTPESAAALRQFGLEVATKPGWKVAWNREIVERFFAYHDWASDQVIAALEGADDNVLDRDFGIGFGSIRKTLQHLLDSERWWWRNWTEGEHARERSEPMDLAALRAAWEPLQDQRRQFIAGLDQASADRIMTVNPAGFSVKMRVYESLVQVCCHGTHHRAQLANMLRQSQRPPLAVDMIDWVRQTGAAA